MSIYTKYHGSSGVIVEFLACRIVRRQQIEQRVGIEFCKKTLPFMPVTSPRISLSD